MGRELGDPLTSALCEGMAGVASYFGGHFPMAIERMDRAEVQFRDCIGAWGEIVRVRRFALIKNRR